MKQYFPRIKVVLVGAQGPLNIGSVCRAMGNFGFSELRLVAPETDHLANDARQMAVKAKDILEGARIYPDLAAALADCSFAIGTTRRYGKYREDLYAPDGAAEALVARPAEETVALVFGREDHGLFTEELDLCQRTLTISTNDDMPSMNLAQAVSLCLYEVTRAARRASTTIDDETNGKKLASNETLESMFFHMRRSLVEAGYLDPVNPDHILRGFRRIFGRAGLNDREVRILHGLWSRIDWLEGERRKLTERLRNNDK
ncbi:MAG: RNA methyltransferase [Desulfuromonadaceae bacterium]|nr:RNA methyltransferase [Desulfuromonadaceae bacterium]